MMSNLRGSWGARVKVITFKQEVTKGGMEGVVISLTRLWCSWVSRKILANVMRQSFLVAGGSGFWTQC